MITDEIYTTMLYIKTDDICIIIDYTFIKMIKIITVHWKTRTGLVTAKNLNSVFSIYPLIYPFCDNLN